MKKSILLFAIILAGSQLKAQDIFNKWEALNDFHLIMSQTFHPAEEDNLEPIKTKSEDLSAKAELLAKSEVPVDYKTEPIMSAVAQLQKDSKALTKLVEGKKASDEEIKKSLYDLHDVFHNIVGLCKGEEHE